MCCRLCGCNNGMGIRGLFELCSVEHFNTAGLAVCAGCHRADVSAADLSSLERLPHKLRHIVSEASISNLPRNSAGSFRRPCRYGGNGLTRKCCAVSGSHPAKNSPNESNTSTHAHTGTAVNDSIPDITVSLEFAGKPSSKPAGCGTSPSGSRTVLAEHAARALCAVSHSTDYSCGHQQFHAHAGAGLRYIEPHSSHITVEFLRSFEECQRTE